jgi:hypothetical protein
MSGKNKSRREENGEVRHADHNVADKSGGKISKCGVTGHAAPDG